MIFSDERYLKKLKEAVINAGMEEGIAVDLQSLVKSEQVSRMKNGQNRVNEVCFFYDMDYYQDYDMFLMDLGGEFVHNALYSKRENSLITDEIAEKIKKLGTPCVVEFFIRGCWLNESYRFDLAKHMMEKWIYDDLRDDEGDHRYDGRLEIEIPPSQIIETSY